MRILIMSTDSVPVPPPHYGGIERVVAEVATGMMQRGHQVALLALAGSKLDGVECQFWKMWPGIPTSIGYGVQALRAARLFKADLIHCFGQTKWILPWCMTGRRAVISYPVLPQLRVRKMLRLFTSQVLLAGCSNYISNSGRELIGGRWRTVYNCVDSGRYTCVETVGPNAPLVFLSRIDRIKGAHLAIDIAERSGRRLVIAGNIASGGDSQRYWLRDVKPRLDGSKIEYIGPVNDEQKNQLLGQAAALIVPIQWDEPFGLVFIEALACGTPVISFARGALPEIVRNGIEGFLGNTPDELVRATGRLAEIDRRACRRRVEECFSKDRIVRSYEELYLELLDRTCAKKSSLF
jgi:glycosyltransferase involved in cell wall biosynthesis